MEVVFTMLIFGIVAGAVLLGIAFAMKQQYHIRDTKLATQALVEKTEVLRLFTLEEVRDANIMPRTFVDGKFTGTTTVSKVPFKNTYADDMAQVTFTINWVTLGSPRTLTWTTYVARAGLVSYGF
jgi:hypothetical protein